MTKTLCIDLFVSDQGYFSFNNLLYRTKIPFARNRSSMAVGYPDNTDIIFSFGSLIEELIPCDKKTKKEVCRCHEKLKIIFSNNTPLTKNTSKIKSHFRRLQDKHLPAMLRSVERGMALTSEKIYFQLQNKIKTHSSILALNKIRWGDINQILRTAVSVGAITLFEAAGTEAVQIVKKLKFNSNKIIKKATIEDAALGISFNIWDTHAQEWIKKNTGTLVRNINDQTKEALKAVIQTKIAEGLTMSEAAKQIQPLIGLNVAQAKAVENLEIRLTDAKVNSNVVKKRINVYTKKLHKARSMMIARTEARAAVTAGQVIGYQQSYVKKVRFSASAGACPVCDGFDGRIYNIGKISLDWEPIPTKPGTVSGHWSGFKGK